MGHVVAQASDVLYQGAGNGVAQLGYQPCITAQQCIDWWLGWTPIYGD